ncbi:MAG TPA: alpha/beta hydrolase [Chthoniobacterales bacterium]|nr:alpha/beta hydrolase [Chthoniobacterales bacterium]
MMTFFRWLGRTLMALLILLLLAGTWICWKFEQWKKEALVTLDAGSKIAQTAAGPIEYTEAGSGPAILICHGAPGGYDQAALIGRDLAKNGFRVIAPSRPGFLRTPLTTGLLFEDQANALAALLDTLGVKKAGVVGFSSGTQIAERFALQHPDRTDALVLIDPLTIPYRRVDKSEPRLITDTALLGSTGDMGAWLFVKQATRDPRWMLDVVFAADTSLKPEDRRKLVDSVLNDPAQLAFFQQLVGTQAPLSPRETGTRNDIVLLRASDPVAFGKISVPTLLIKGSADIAGKWNDLKPITDKLPTARVLTVKDAGQLVWFGPHAAKVQEDMIEFLKHPSPAPTPTPTPAPAPTPAAN